MYVFHICKTRMRDKYMHIRYFVYLRICQCWRFTTHIHIYVNIIDIHDNKYDLFVFKGYVTTMATDR